jgi:chemotaxis protein MotB
MDDDSQTKPALNPMKRKVPASLAVLVVAGLGGASYYSWGLYNHNSKLSGELNEQQKTSTKLGDLSADLNTKLASCQEELDLQTTALNTKTKEVETTSVALTMCRGSVSDLKSQKEKAEAQLKEQDAFTEKFRKLIDTGKLVVEFRHGRMIVELPSSILFSSGSAELSPEGEEALADVATILKTVPKNRFIIAGHTDNTPPGKNDKFESNWELSTMRALTVTEVLIKKGMKPTKLAAAGYGEFSPIAKNSSAAGRQKNRRIEIIVEPDLSDIEDLADKEDPPKAAKAEKPASKAKK